MYGLPISTLFGVALLAYAARRWASKRGGAATLVLVVCGGAMGAVVYVGCEIFMWIFSWLEQPAQWEVLLFSVVVQAAGVWRLHGLLGGGAPAPVSVGAGAPAARDAVRTTAGPPTGRAARWGADSTSMEILHSLAALVFLGGIFVAVFWTMAPPYRDKMVLMLWFLPIMGLASMIEGVRGIGAGLARHEVLFRAGLGAILILAGYTGLRLQYGHPILPL